MPSHVFDNERTNTVPNLEGIGRTSIVILSHQKASDTHITEEKPNRGGRYTAAYVPFSLEQGVCVHVGARTAWEMKALAK